MKFLAFSKYRTGVNPRESADVFQQTYDRINPGLADGTFDCVYNFLAINALGG